MLDSRTQLDTVALLREAGANIDPITVITALKYNASIMKTLNNITFAYDPNWEYEGDTPTYPITFFFVQSMTETMETEVSSKPMLFYDTTNNGNEMRAGLMNIVADNIIIKPKTYKLSIIIPANISIFDNTINGNMVGTDFIASKVLNGEEITDFMYGMNNGLRITKDIFRALFKSVYGTSMSMDSLYNMLVQQQDYNKASLENMWRNRRVIKLKLWNGWKFKYLVITSLDIEKRGEDGEFYTGNLLCQELPILTFRQQEKDNTIFFTSKIIDKLKGIVQKSDEFADKIKAKKIKKASDTFVSTMETITPSD